MKNFLVGLIKDIIDQAWTLLGMAVAWLVLEGSAKELTGNLIVITLCVWVITFPPQIREARRRRGQEVIITYLKHFYSLKQKDLAPLALASWREYIKGKKRIYNMDVCTRYQQAFVHSYRHEYAISKIKKS
jgi:hypothetical protein